MKVLGFVFSPRPTASAHFEQLRRRFRRQYWILLHLKNFGFTHDELCKVYRTIVRPTADHLCVVYHSLLTDYQDEELDRCQAHALRCIFGKDMSYKKMREMAGVGTLRERREELCDKFAAKCLKSTLYREWFPERQVQGASRGAEKYQEHFARCDRLRNSTVFYMRRRLNGKPGKRWGPGTRCDGLGEQGLTSVSILAGHVSGGFHFDTKVGTMLRRPWGTVFQ